jgi:hypothetical protein
MAQLARSAARLILLVALLSAGAAPAVSQTAAARAAACTSTATPVGALPPAIPIFCETAIGTALSTSQTGPDSWRDDFGFGTKIVSLGDGYTVFDNLSGQYIHSQHWRQNKHWMVDVFGTPSDVGGAMMRPNRSFTFQNGKLVIEAQVAAGIEAYGGDAWPEIVVSTSPQPGKVVDGGLYAYGAFGGYWTTGCRLQSSRVPICALFDNTGRTVFTGGRRFELSFFQESEGPGAFHSGGGPYTAATNAAWRTCDGTNPDVNCRDMFRWELTRDRLTLFVNGVQYMQHYLGSSPEFQLPDAIVNGPVYVYFAERVYQPRNVVTRFHWQHLAVNPAELAGIAPATVPETVPSAGPPTPAATPATDTGAPTPRPAKTSTSLSLVARLASGYWWAGWALSVILLLAGAGIGALALRSRSRVRRPPG